MKSFWKNTAVVAASLILTVSLIAGLSVGTMAASFSGQQVGTNNCVEEGLTNPDGTPYTKPFTEPISTEETTFEPTEEEDYGPTLELFCELEITQPYDGAPVETIGMYQKVPGFSPHFTLDLDSLPPSDIPYYVTLNVLSCIFPSDPPTYVNHAAFYVREQGVVHFYAYAHGGYLEVSGETIELTDYIPPTGPTEPSDTTEPFDTTEPSYNTEPSKSTETTEEPTTEEPTTMEPTEYPETLELYCDLEITQPYDGAPVESFGMEQKVPGFSPDFTLSLDSLPPSEIPYYATLYVGSCIYPGDPPVFEDHVAFYVREQGTVYFHAYAPGGSLDVRGENIELTEYIPPTKPTYPTEPFETTEPTEATVTYPYTEPTPPPVWTTSPTAEVTTDPLIATSQPATEPVGKTLLYGDANGDGIISIEDVTLIQLYAAEKITLENAYVCDVTGDGKVDIADATCVQRYIAEFTSGIGKTGSEASAGHPDGVSNNPNDELNDKYVSKYSIFDIVKMQSKILARSW